ncbi:MAG: hypothetical protein ACRD2X_03025 [Vicinamibacteraceae bacterium]
MAAITHGRERAIDEGLPRVGMGGIVMCNGGWRPAPAPGMGCELRATADLPGLRLVEPLDRSVRSWPRPSSLSARRTALVAVARAAPSAPACWTLGHERPAFARRRVQHGESVAHSPNVTTTRRSQAWHRTW